MSKILNQINDKTGIINLVGETFKERFWGKDFTTQRELTFSSEETRRNMFSSQIVKELSVNTTTMEAILGSVASITPSKNGLAHLFFVEDKNNEINSVALLWNLSDGGWDIVSPPDEIEWAVGTTVYSQN